MEIRKIRIVSLILLAMALSAGAFGQTKVDWKSWKEGMKIAKESNKKVIVSLYTDWCGWCKKMESSTFSHEVVAQYINDNYVAIKFDAEQAESEEYQGKSYSYRRGGRRGYHTLAARLTNGRLSYPSTVFLDENGAIIQAIPGYQDAPGLETILNYFANDYHKNTPWVSFQRRFVPQSNAMAPTPTSNHTRLVSKQKGN